MHDSLNPSVACFRLGDHICLLYRSEKELLGNVVPYVQLGLKRNEQCFCFLPSKVSSKLVGALKAEGLQVDSLIKGGALVLQDPEQAYLAGGRFAPEAMKTLLASSVQGARRKGFSGFRGVGDMRWALSKKPGCNRLLEYETLMETFFPVRPAVAMCTYPAHHFSAEKLRDLLAVHHFALLEGRPGAKRRTLRIHSGMLFGDIAFDHQDGAPFDCLIHRKSGEILSWTQKKTLRAAYATVKQQLQDLRGSVQW
jgi:hypothetical protein